MNLQQTILLSIFIVLMSQTAYSANPAHGKELHDANCQSCHSSLMGGNPDLIYTRSDRRVNSIDGLRNQVTRCKTTVGVAWPEDQIQDVVEYLNTNFYKLK
ncbi:MAG: c-type cytochrome [Gammaproteobacteria bacterium]|nr:c-type cytochrome [Gammaproteobacteria bacterium]